MIKKDQCVFEVIAFYLQRKNPVKRLQQFFIQRRDSIPRQYAVKEKDEGRLAAKYLMRLAIRCFGFLHLIGLENTIFLSFSQVNNYLFNRN